MSDLIKSGDRPLIELVLSSYVNATFTLTMEPLEDILVFNLGSL